METKRKFLDSEETPNNKKAKNEGGTKETNLTTTIIKKIMENFIEERWEYKDVCCIALINKEWKQIAYTLFNAFYEEIYVTRTHLETLYNIIYNEYHKDSDFIFSELPTWKPNLVNLVINEREEEKEEDREDVNFSSSENFPIPQDSPLCPGTVEKQYRLIRDDITTDEYQSALMDTLKVKANNIDDDLLAFKNLVFHEMKEQKIYIDEIMKSEYLKYKMLYYDEDNDEQEEVMPLTNEVTKGYPVQDVTLFNGDQLCFNYGIHDLARRGGVLFYEPSVTIFLRNHLKKYLKKIMCVLAKKNEGIEVNYTEKDYTGIFRGNDHEGDDVDEEYKINREDVAKALEEVTGSILYPFEEYIYESDNNDGDGSDDESDMEKDESHKDDEQEKNKAPVITQTLCGDDEEEEYTEDEETEEDRQFIDDSEYRKEFDPEVTRIAIENGDYVSLEDRLIFASFIIHEQVYGKERTHQEKKYLTNWFGNSKDFHKWIEIPPFSLQSSPPSPSPPSSPEDDSHMLTEEEIIERDRKEDKAYFGFSLFDSGPEFTRYWNEEFNEEWEGYDKKMDSNNAETDSDIESDVESDSDSDIESDSDSESSQEGEAPDTEKGFNKEVTMEEVEDTEADRKEKEEYDEDYKAKKVRWLLRTESYRVIQEFFNIEGGEDEEDEEDEEDIEDVEEKLELSTLTKEKKAKMFYLACKLGRVREIEYLINTGLSVHDTFKGSPLLLWAAKSGKRQVMELLLKHGANIDGKEIDAKKLESGEEKESDDKDSVKEEDEDEEPEDDIDKYTFRNPLIAACNNKKFQAAKFLLQHGADPNICEDFIDWREKTPLHILCEFEEDPPGAMELAELLIRHGAKMDSKCCRTVLYPHYLSEYDTDEPFVERSPLSMAILSKSPKMVSMLVRKDRKLLYQHILDDDMSHNGPVVELCDSAPEPYWSPSSHFQYSDDCRASIRTLLLVAHRQHWPLDKMLMHKIINLTLLQENK